jgi:quercetin dioxygenase-like cupin family protein
MPKMRHAAIMVLVVAMGGCVEEATQPVSPSAPSVAAASTSVLRTSTTITGQPLAAPPSPWEILVTRTELPSGGLLPMHKHPWPRYAFVQRGRLEVRYEQSGLVRTFGPGEAVVEAVDQWHEGRVIGAEPVTLIVLDQLPPGATNVVRR